MSSVIEVPDWTRPVSVMGKDSEGNPVTVLLDSLGRLICVLYGAITLSGPVDVTQVDSTREIQGADGVTLHTIAVDSEGRIIAIVKGEYAGTLKNLAVDASGRMIMIPTDPADIWGNAISMGNAELAARLTGFGGFDRRGQWVWGTDFENGLQGMLIGIDDAASVGQVTTSRACHGGLSLKLDPRGAASAYARVSKVLSLSLPTKVGMEVAVSTDSNPYLLYWAMWYFDGTNAHKALLKYDPATGNWSILDQTNTLQTILSGYYLQQGANAWHQVKMVADFANDKNIRVLVGKNVIDTSAYGLYKYLASDLGQILIRLECQGSVDISEAAFFDSWCITQNEPA